MISDKIDVTGKKKSPSKHSTHWNGLMLPPPALSNMTISKQRITDAEFMSVASAIVNHIFAELQLQVSCRELPSCPQPQYALPRMPMSPKILSAILTPVPSPLYSVFIRFYTSFIHSASVYNEIHHCVQIDFGLQIMQHNICTYLLSHKHTIYEKVLWWWKIYLQILMNLTCFQLPSKYK